MSPLSVTFSRFHVVEDLIEEGENVKTHQAGDAGDAPPGHMVSFQKYCCRALDTRYTGGLEAPRHRRTEAGPLQTLPSNRAARFWLTHILLCANFHLKFVSNVQICVIMSD